MAEAMYRPPDGYMTLHQAQDRLGISKATMHRMVRDRKLVTFDDPRNGRVKLVLIADIEALEQPKPRFRAA